MFRFDQVTGHGSTRRSDRRCGQQPQKASRVLFSECQTENITVSSHQTAKSSSSTALSPDSSKLGPSLIPKISRLQPNEINNAIQANGQFLFITTEYYIRRFRRCFFFFFRIKLKGNYIIIVLFFEIFHTFSNSVQFSKTNKSFANFFFIF